MADLGFLTKHEIKLIKSTPKEIKLPIPPPKSKPKRGTWKQYLKDDEFYQIENLSPDSDTYKRIRSACYQRKYYSDPQRKILTDKRNLICKEKRKIQMREKLIGSIDIITEKRKNKKQILAEKQRIRSRERYHEVKDTPGFKELEKERNANFLKKNPNYRREYYLKNGK